MNRRKDVATLAAAILVGFASVAGSLVTLFGSGPAVLLWIALPLVLALVLVVDAAEIGEGEVETDSRVGSQEVSD